MRRTVELPVRIADRDFSGGSVFYPDLAIFCGKPQLADDYNDILLNPKVIFEVLSKSSEAHDRGYKFSLYRQIESLQDYGFVSQTEPRIEVFSRGGEGQWIMNESIVWKRCAGSPASVVEMRLPTFIRMFRSKQPDFEPTAGPKFRSHPFSLIADFSNRSNAGGAAGFAGTASYKFRGLVEEAIAQAVKREHSSRCRRSNCRRDTDSAPTWRGFR